MMTAGICWLLTFKSYPEEQFLSQIWEDKYKIFGVVKYFIGTNMLFVTDFPVLPAAHLLCA